jgi:hypothetical protein
MNNAKTEPARKDPDEWLSGDDPMTGAQASYLKTLCEQAGTPEAMTTSQKPRRRSSSIKCVERREWDNAGRTNG